MRLILIPLLAALAGCTASGALAPTGPAGEPSSSNVNPITGARGGSSAGSSR